MAKSIQTRITTTTRRKQGGMTSLEVAKNLVPAHLKKIGKNTYIREREDHYVILIKKGAKWSFDSIVQKNTAK